MSWQHKVKRMVEKGCSDSDIEDFIESRTHV